MRHPNALDPPPAQFLQYAATTLAVLLCIPLLAPELMPLRLPLQVLGLRVWSVEIRAVGTRELSGGGKRFCGAQEVVLPVWQKQQYPSRGCLTSTSQRPIRV